MNTAGNERKKETSKMRSDERQLKKTLLKKLHHPIADLLALAVLRRYLEIESKNNMLTIVDGPIFPQIKTCFMSKREQVLLKPCPTIGKTGGYDE